MAIVQTTSRLNRELCAWACAVLVACIQPTVLAADRRIEPLPAVEQALPMAKLVGEGQMRFLGVRVYEARLWAGPQFDAKAYEAHPLALELTYHRTFTGAAIAQRSIEEMQRQRRISGEQAERWRQALATLLPTVQPGDRLTGLFSPGQGMRLWYGTKELGEIPDTELARLFFGIWLSPNTSEPSLRSALLGQMAQTKGPQ